MAEVITTAQGFTIPYGQLKLFSENRASIYIVPDKYSHRTDLMCQAMGYSSINNELLINSYNCTSPITSTAGTDYSDVPSDILQLFRSI